MITYGTPTTGSQVNGASIVIPAPSGLTADTWSYAVVAAANSRVITDPAGWTPVVGPVDVNSGADGARLRVWRRKGTFTGDTTFAFEGGSSRGSGIILPVFGLDGVTPEDATPTTNIDSTSDTSYVAAGITTVTVDAELLCAWQPADRNIPPITWSGPGGMTELVNQAPVPNGALLVCREPRPTTGATGTRTASSSKAVQSVGVTLALRPASTDTTVPVLQSAEIDGDTLTLTYNENLDETADPSGVGGFSAHILALSINGGSTEPAASSSISGAIVTAIYAVGAQAGDTLTLDYNGSFAAAEDRIQDLASNEAADFTGQSVTNNTAAGQAESGSATVSGGGTVTASGSGQVTPIGESGSATIAGGGTVTASGSGSVTPLPVVGNRRTAEYVVIAVDRTGQPIARFPQATVGTVTWTLNDWPTMSFSVPNNHRRVREIQAITTEVQLWRNGVLLDWFVPLRPQGRQEGPDFKCVGLMWWFSRRTVGDSERKNWAAPLVLNPDPYVGWKASGVLATVSNDLGFPAPSILLEQANADTDTYIHHIANVSGAAGAQKWTAKANVHVSSGAGDMPFPSNVFARAYDQRGLHVSVIQTGNNLLMTKFEPLSPEAGHLQPGNYRLEVEVITPEDFLGHVEIRLYAPRSRVAWDNPTLHRDDSLAWSHVDQTVILKGLAEHAQDSAFGKTDLNIGTAGAGSGTRRTAAYFHHDADNVWDEIKRLCEFEHGPDVDMVVTQNSRTFTVYDPSKGSDRDEITYRWGTKSIIDYSWDIDGDAARDRIRALGEGEGSDREEGYYVDPTAWENNALEGVIAAPNTEPWWLDLFAQQSVKRRIDVTVGSITVPAEGTIGRVKVGDRVPIEIDDGWTQVTGWWRVVQITLSPADDTIEMAVNALVPA